MLVFHGVTYIAGWPKLISTWSLPRGYWAKFEKVYLWWKMDSTSWVLEYLLLSYPILSCPILFYPVLSCPILSYPVLSHLSYPILSYPSISLLMYYLLHPKRGHFTWREALAGCFLMKSLILRLSSLEIGCPDGCHWILEQEPCPVCLPLKTAPENLLTSVPFHKIRVVSYGFGWLNL